MVAKANVDGMALVPKRLKELESTCFVIMPFGQKAVGKVQVDFDVVYERLFEPAINSVKTPEKSQLVAHRNRQGHVFGVHRPGYVRVHHVQPPGVC